MSAPPLGELAALLRPLEPVHLGVLARCHAVAVPELRAGNAVQALRDHFGVECSEGVVAVIYDKLLREAPQVLGGAPLPLHGLKAEEKAKEHAKKREDEEEEEVKKKKKAADNKKEEREEKKKQAAHKKKDEEEQEKKKEAADKKKKDEEELQKKKKEAADKKKAAKEKELKKQNAEEKAMKKKQEEQELKRKQKEAAEEKKKKEEVEALKKRKAAEAEKKKEEEEAQKKKKEEKELKTKRKEAAEKKKKKDEEQKAKEEAMKKKEEEEEESSDESNTDTDEGSEEEEEDKGSAEENASSPSCSEEEEEEEVEEAEEASDEESGKGEEEEEEDEPSGSSDGEATEDEADEEDGEEMETAEKGSEEEEEEEEDAAEDEGSEEDVEEEDEAAGADKAEGKKGKKKKEKEAGTSLAETEEEKLNSVTANADWHNIWCSRPDARASCYCVAAPEEVDFLQIVACPRKNSKAFVEVRALWLLRAALLRVRAPFSGFVEMLADLHALPADRRHDCMRFEQHWLLLEALTLLWQRVPEVLPSFAWPLDGQHQTDAYCRDHAAGGSVAVPSDDTILRHRDVDGVRSYKVRGSAAWRLASALSPEAIQAYERRLAEQHERRKRRRCAAAAAGPVAPPAEVGDTVFQDALEPEMHPQPDDVNPCGIDKVVLLPRRSYGGLLVATLPCGRVCAAVPLAHAESLTQVYALLSTLVLEDTDVRCPLQYVIYDNACALARFARHPVRKDRTDAAEETYLVQHEVSKRHGKLKGKHLRHALNWHNVVCGYHQSDPQAWPTTVTAASLRAAEILGGYCEQVAEVITKFAAEIQKRETAAKEDKTEKKDGRTQGNHIDALRRMSCEDFLGAVPPGHRLHLVAFGAVLLKMHTVWLDSTALRSHCFVRDTFPGLAAEAKLLFVWRTVSLLERLSVCICGLTTNAYGPKRLLAVKRPLPTEDGDTRRVFLDVLHLLGVEPGTHHGLSMAETLAKSPPNAPTLAAGAVDVAAVAPMLERGGLQVKTADPVPETKSQGYIKSPGAGKGSPQATGPGSKGARAARASAGGSTKNGAWK
eukprot:g13869.t1